MDLNLVVMCGRAAAEPELRRFDSGSTLLRLLVTVRSEHPRRRIDVLPVAFWDPPEQLVDEGIGPGTRLWIAGSLQRRFWDGPDGRRSRLEMVASAVHVLDVRAEPVCA